MFIRSPGTNSTFVQHDLKGLNFKISNSPSVVTDESETNTQLIFPGAVSFASARSPFKPAAGETPANSSTFGLKSKVKLPFVTPEFFSSLITASTSSDWSAFLSTISYSGLSDWPYI